jgi:hypothetical protein
MIRGLGILELGRPGLTIASSGGEELDPMQVLAREAEETALAARVAARAGSAVFNEPWTNLSAWNGSGVGQVSGGFLYPDGGGFGISRALAFPDGNGTILGKMKVVAAGGGTAYLALGVNVDTPGAVPGGGSGFRGIGIDQNTNTLVSITNTSVNGTLSIDSGTLAAGDYYFYIVIDGLEMTATVINAAHTVEYGHTFTLPSNPTNVQVWLSASRGTSSSGFGPIGARGDIATIVPRTAVEGIIEKPTYVTLAGSQRCRIEYPIGYDSSVTTPVVMYFHGVGENDRDVWGDSNKATLDLQSAGYIVASSNVHGDNWGNQTSIDDGFNLYEYLRTVAPIGPVLILSQSMGGPTGLQTLADTRIPGVCGWAGIYPVINLAYEYATYPTFAALIKTAFGIAADGSDYAAKTAGYDVALLADTAFRHRTNPTGDGVPLRFYASAGDTVVPKAQNTDPFAARVAAHHAEADVVVCSGDHGDISHFQSADLLAFFGRCVASA